MAPPNLGPMVSIPLTIDEIRSLPALAVTIGDGGRKMYVSEDIGLNRIYEWDLSTPYDVSSATLDQSSNNAIFDESAYGYQFTPDGLTLYVSGEESVSQIKIRADRLGVRKKTIQIMDI